MVDVTNEFLEAARNANSQEENSEERYEKLKKQEAGTSDTTPAEERFNELKEKAKQEFKRKEREREEAEEEEEEDGEESDPFVTY
ncbi:MAG: hypothetical protein ABEJ75_03575 [Candidatus Nanohaloarchaea archaeon]